MDEVELKNIFRELDVFGLLDGTAQDLKELDLDVQTVVALFRMYADRLEAEKG